MYMAWKRDASSVHLSWQAYFNALENGQIPPEYAFQPSPGLISAKPINSTTASSTCLISEKSSALGDQMKVQLLVRAYQARGHSQAKIDPLNIAKEKEAPHQELQLEYYGFSEADLDREFLLGPGLLPNFASENRKSMTLGEIIKACETVYCGSYGVEYLHIPSGEECDWIRSRIERPDPWRFSVEEKKRILDRLIWATSFENFLAAKFPNAKRFGLEGVESQIPALKAIVDTSADHGVRNIVFACCHRGKLNVLSNVVRKPNELIFNEFSSNSTSRHPISGDVKYHLGMNYERETPSGKKVNISVLPNPSHLESIDPLAQGMARAIQQQNQMDQGSTMVLNSHTDAAVSGQGIVYETLLLSDLKAYGTGGTVHLVVNNQVGFTTDPTSSRSSTYVSDIAKSIDSPIFHVNADDIEAVIFISKLVADYRAKFRKDCWIDLVCYRKNGHNEMDQPSFTQPLMYERIAKKISHLNAYTDKLLKEGVVTRKEVDRMQDEVWGKLSESLDKSKDSEAMAREYLTVPWKDLKTPEQVACEVTQPQPTAITSGVLNAIASKMGVPKEPFSVHNSLKRILQKRQQSLIDGSGIDWATGEALALGSLLLEGHHVRISGQDVERGTFSQRHAVLHDQKTGGTYTPLDSLSPDQARFSIINSPLSEVGVMGFDYGYSCMYPNALVIWEAQFGDFANNAQVIIDQFISSAENKWLQRSGIVLSLPHGFDGQGPEHSSARIERFLQLCAEDSRAFPSEEKLARQHQDANMQVVCMTAPANLFHVLRRQLHRDFRKRKLHESIQLRMPGYCD